MEKSFFLLAQVAPIKRVTVWERSPVLHLHHLQQNDDDCDDEDGDDDNVMMAKEIKCWGFQTLKVPLQAKPVPAVLATCVRRASWRCWKTLAKVCMKAASAHELEYLKESQI